MPSIGLSIGHVHRVGAVVAASGFSLTAPLTAFEFATDPDSDNTQNLVTTFYNNIETYYIRTVGTFGSATVSAPYDVDDASNLIDATEAGNLATSFTTGAIPDGLVSFKQRIESGPGTPVSDWGNTISKTISTTSKLLLVAGGTNNLLLVDGTSNLLLAA